MTGFTHEYLSLDSYYSQGQNCTTAVTHKHFQLVSNHSQAVSPIVLHEPDTQFIFKIFRSMKCHMRFL